MKITNDIQAISAILRIIVAIFVHALILIMKLIGKVIGVPVIYFFFLIDKIFKINTRAYARNRVYNYVLEHNLYLPRLLEKEYTLKDGIYKPKKISHKNFKLKNDGFIKYKKVNFLEFILAFSIWIWFDDDSNYDTHDGSESEETEQYPFGNTWDLGDKRAEFPIIREPRTFKWILRNTFYNANYFFEECRENSPLFFYFKFPKLKMHWGYIPYTNSSRKGRLVFFTEDYDKLD